MLTASLAALAWLAVAGPARADLQDKAYDDIKGLVEELITAEIAEAVVPNVVCRAPEIVNHYPRSLQRIFDRQFASLRGSLQDETAALVAYQVLVSTDPRFSLGKKKEPRQTLLLTGSKGGPASSSEPTSEAAVRDCELEAILKQLAAKEEPMDACRTHVRACFKKHHYATFDAKSLTEACSGPAALAPTQQLSCALALAAQGSLQGRLDTVEVQLFQALGVVLSDVAGRATNVDAVARSRATLDVTMLVRDFVLSPTSPSAAAFIDEVRAALGAQQSAEVTEKLAPVANAVQRIRTHWRAITSSTVKLDFPTFVASLAGAGSSVAALCSTSFAASSDACSVVNGFKTSFGVGGDAYLTIRALQRRDYREISMLAIRDLFERLPEPDPKDEDAEEKLRTRVLYRQFSESVAAYVLDVASEGEPSVGSRAAFKDAAFEVVREVASDKSSGFDRPWTSKILIPDFALRYTYSSSFINEASGDGFRFSPTIDWLTFRKDLRYKEHGYAALQVSLVDLAGPFSEMALRRNEVYGLGTRVWGEAFRPRVEVMLGLPALSTKLAMTVGASLRATTPIARPSTTGGPTTYEYRWFTEGKEPGYTPDLGKFTEMSIALKYVP